MNSAKKYLALCHFAQVISALPDPDHAQDIAKLRENFIVSDSRRPFCKPTKHILVTRIQETKTFPKSTYASGDAGIADESQKETTSVEIK